MAKPLKDFRNANVRIALRRNEATVVVTIRFGWHYCEWRKRHYGFVCIKLMILIFWTLAQISPKRSRRMHMAVYSPLATEQTETFLCADSIELVATDFFLSVVLRILVWQRILSADSDLGTISRVSFAFYLKLFIDVRIFADLWRSLPFEFLPRHSFEWFGKMSRIPTDAFCLPEHVPFQITFHLFRVVISNDSHIGMLNACWAACLARTFYLQIHISSLRNKMCAFEKSKLWCHIDDWNEQKESPQSDRDEKIEMKRLRWKAFDFNLPSTLLMLMRSPKPHERWTPRQKGFKL